MRSRKLFSEVRADGTLALSVDEVEIGAPAADEVIIRIDAAPINPSDLILLFGGADPGTFTVSGREAKAQIPLDRLGDHAGRIGAPLATGNEGAGLVVDAGRNAAHLIGKTVACMGRAMYAGHIRLPAGVCHVLPDGITAAQGAASLVNPLTALAMIETMRGEGHAALAHTAAASSLGQMLNRLCIEDGIPLVNIVRRQSQADLLRGQGAQHVCISSDGDFLETLAAAIERTRTTLAFDAIGGGPIAGQLLDAMEAVELRHAPHYSRYGSMMRKQVYIYGCLDDRAITFRRGAEFSWNIAGWLLPLTAQQMAAFWGRIAAGLKTVFATHYVETLSLDGLLDPARLASMAQKATNRKFLVTPHASAAVSPV